MVVATTRSASPPPFTPPDFPCEVVSREAFLTQFRTSLTEQVALAIPAFYTGYRDAPWAPLGLLKRTPIGEQGTVIRAGACAIRGVGRLVIPPTNGPKQRGLKKRSRFIGTRKRRRSLILVGEMGTGKTFMSLAMLAMADEEVTGMAAPLSEHPEKSQFFPAVVLCPPILLEKWAREARATLPHARVVIIRDLDTRAQIAEFQHFDPSFKGCKLSAMGVTERAVARIRTELATWQEARRKAALAGLPMPPKPCHVMIVSNSTAKLASAWTPRYVLRTLKTTDPETGRIKLLRDPDEKPYIVPCCPRCFSPIRSDSAKKRQIDDPDAAYLSEAKLWGSGQSQARRVCQALVNTYRKDAHGDSLWEPCGEPLWQSVPELTADAAAASALWRGLWKQQGLPEPGTVVRDAAFAPTWRALPPPVEGVRSIGYLIDTDRLKDEIRTDREQIARFRLPALALPDKVLGSSQVVTASGAAFPTIKSTAHLRFPIAEFLHERFPGVFKSFIADEVQMYQGGTTAQAFAFASLVSAVEPDGTVLMLTGTLFSGYADELFELLRKGMAEIRQHFGYDDMKRWMELLGRAQRIVTTSTVDRQDGAVSKRREKSETVKRKEGISPWVLRYLLPNALFVPLSCVAPSLPPLTEEVREIPLGPMLEPIYRVFERVATEELRKQLRKKDKSALASWFQGLMVQPNAPWEEVVIRNARTQDVLASSVPLPEDAITPKEIELLKIVREQRANKRRVLIGLEHTQKYDVQARLLRLIEEDDQQWLAGLPPGGEAADDEEGTPHWVSPPRPAGPPVRVADLRSSVESDKREAWIAKTVAKGCDVMLCQSALVEVGLDLVDFPTIVCYETIFSTCRARQFTRRSYRPQQREPVLVIQLTYQHTAESNGLLLVARKQRFSLMVEGKLPTGVSSYGEEEDDDIMLQLAHLVMAGAHESVAQELQTALQQIGALEREADTYIVELEQEGAQQQPLVVVQEEVHEQSPLLRVEPETLLPPSLPQETTKPTWETVQQQLEAAIAQMQERKKLRKKNAASKQEQAGAAQTILSTDEAIHQATLWETPSPPASSPTPTAPQAAPEEQVSLWGDLHLGE